METSYSVNQIVWAKINGYPWWPAYVNTTTESDRFEVVFFGDFSRALLSTNKIKDFGEISHRVDGKNKSLDAAVRSVQRVLDGESTIMEEWQRCNKSTPPKRKLSKKKSAKKAEKTGIDEADEVSLCLSQRSKTKYANFLNKMEADAKLELKRFHSMNNKLTTSSFNPFAESALFNDDIAGVEEQLESLWLALRGQSFDAERCTSTL